MNNSILTIVVAGVLTVAWSYVLGRPVLSKISYLVRRMRSSDGGINYVRPSVWSLGAGIFRPILRPARAWRQQSVFVRRRQILVALVLAFVLSASLAAAFRGFYLLPVAVAGLALAAYLNAAIRIGGDLVHWQNYVQTRSANASIVQSDGVVSNESVASLEQELDGTERVDVGSALRDRREPVSEVIDPTDPTLKVKGSRRRKGSIPKDPSRRMIFRRPQGERKARPVSSSVVSSDWSHLDKVANDH